jgi:trans-aconitate methyltransferase
MVVDLGCGPGHTLAALRRRWPETKLIGIDLQPAGARQAGLDSGVLLVRADLSHPLPLRTASVAGLVCHNVVELLPNPGQVFAEARRVLHPGGQAVWSHTDSRV